MRCDLNFYVIWHYYCFDGAVDGGDETVVVKAVVTSAVRAKELKSSS